MTETVSVMATIYDIAKAANSSTASVSRVLNGKSGVKAETAQRIRKAMEDLNFQPRWRAMERNRLVVLIPDYKGVLSNSHVSRILSGITDTAFSMGYNIQLRPFDSQSCNPKDLRHMLNQEIAAGCLIISLNETYIPSSDIDLTGLPHIVVGHKQKDDGINQICFDDFKAGYDATDYLIQIGHTRIDIVTFSHIDAGHLERYQGYKKAMEDAGLKIGNCVELNDATVEAGKSASRRLFNLKKPPSAIVITNEELAIGFQQEALNLGVSIPNDVSLIAFESGDLPALMHPAVTAMRTPTYTIGTEATRILLEQIQNLEEGKNSKEVDSSFRKINIPLMVRHTTAQTSEHTKL